VPAYAIAPPICSRENRQPGHPTHAMITGNAIALRVPAIAIGFQSIDFTKTPPRLQSTAVISSRAAGKRR